MEVDSSRLDLGQAAGALPKMQGYGKGPQMIARLFDIFFGCWHRKYTFPIKRGRGHYIVCLDCGKEFEYDWDLMRSGREIQQPLFSDADARFLRSLRIAEVNRSEARRIYDDIRGAGATGQKPLKNNVRTIERKKA
jgi:hypothetical protein